MSFTYLLSSNVGKVRLLIPDTVAATAELSDEEIEQFLSWRGNNVNAAAVMACEQLARKYAQAPTFTDTSFSVSNGERARLYAERAKELAAQLGGHATTKLVTRSDGYSDAAGSTDYESTTIYIKV